MKVAYKISDLERLSSINKTTLDNDEIGIDADVIEEVDNDFYRIVDGKVKKKTQVEVQAILSARTAEIQSQVDKITTAKTTLAALITTQTSDPNKVKLTDLLERVRQLEIILGY